MKIKFYGHAGIKIEDDLVLLIDPWLNDNPLATMKAEDITKADYIIATHNHFDHTNDIPIIANNTGATVVGIVETVEDLASKGCNNTLGCNIGGKVKLKGLELVFTQAFHSMSSNPSGVIIFYNNNTHFENRFIYKFNLILLMNILINNQFYFSTLCIHLRIYFFSIYNVKYHF